nr:hypothetical protein GCM10020092_023300 [Actinoplanes digitatis]
MLSRRLRPPEESGTNEATLSPVKRQGEVGQAVHRVPALHDEELLETGAGRLHDEVDPGHDIRVRRPGARRA